MKNISIGLKIMIIFKNKLTDFFKDDKLRKSQTSEETVTFREIKIQSKGLTALKVGNICLLFYILIFPIMAKANTLDQENLIADDSFSNVYITQTFTPTYPGDISKIEVYARDLDQKNYEYVDFNLFLSDNNDRATGTPLATKRFYNDEFFYSYTWTVWDLDTPVTIIPAQKYLIGLHRTGEVNRPSFQASWDNVYSFGSGGYSDEDWTITNVIGDLAFKTYTSTTTEEPEPEPEQIATSTVNIFEPIIIDDKIDISIEYQKKYIMDGTSTTTALQTIYIYTYKPFNQYLFIYSVILLIIILLFLLTYLFSIKQNKKRF